MRRASTFAVDASDLQRAPTITHNLRRMSFNGHAWISSLRYGFPFGPQLGSFVHQYCSDKDKDQHGSPCVAREEPIRSGAPTSSSDEDPRTVVLDDISADPEMRAFTYDRSPCYAGSGRLDAKAARLIMQRRHDAANALHAKRLDKHDSAAAAHTFHPTLTFDLLRQVREMYRGEMAKRAQEREPKEESASTLPGAPPGLATAVSSRDFGSSIGNSRATSALDEVFLDDAAIYVRALVYVSGGSRLARDWIAGCAALSTNHPSLITIAMQHQGTHEDLEDLARYCEIIGYWDDKDCSLLNESKRCE